MAKYISCGRLFSGLETKAQVDQTIVVDGDTITYVGSAKGAPAKSASDETVDFGSYLVFPGLIDLHTHLTYGNAMCEEDIDLYAPAEFRALRGLINAQRLIGAGFTSMADPGGSTRVAVSIRDAINANLFPGPRITCSGAYITTRQGLTDWYPTWFGQPETSIGHLVRNLDEAIEEVRVQVKDGVDFIKLAMDGRQRNARGEQVAAFNQAETEAIVGEVHRLGKKVAAHAWGKEATLYCARAKVDLIFHAFMMDDRTLDAVVDSGSAIAPTLTLPYRINIFLQPTDPGFTYERAEAFRRFWEPACAILSKAREAGVPFMTGTDSRFSGTPYREWHAREIEIFAKYLGFTPGEAMRCATSISAGFLTQGEQVGALEFGRKADFVVFDGDPLGDVGQILEKERINQVWLAGKPIELKFPPLERKGISDFSYKMWQDIYDQDHVTELRGKKRTRQIAAAAE